MSGPADALRRLSQLERNVLTLKGRGLRPKDIAKEVRGGLTAESVEDLLAVIRFKLDGAGPEPDLEYLVNLATREHVAAVRSSEEWVEHAITAGDALLRARELVPHGRREEWLRSLSNWPVSAAQAYMRIARHREEVREAGVATIREAIHALTGGELDSAHVPVATKPVDLAKVRRDRDQRDRAEIVIAFGGAVAEAWASVAAALEQIDAAIAEQASTDTQRRDLTLAMGRLRRVQDDLANVARDSERRAA